MDPDSASSTLAPDALDDDWMAYSLAELRDLFCIETSLFALALAALYLGAHAALVRPHSAAPPLPPPPPSPHSDDDKKKTQRRARDRGRGRARDPSPQRESLQASDALLLPLMAACSLVGLYYLIQYLEDAALLNRIVRAYTSLAAVATLGKFLGDGLQTAASVVFPTVWVAGDGTLYRVDAQRQQQLRRDDDGADADADADAHANAVDSSSSSSWVVDPTRASPFPDRLAGWLRLAGKPAARPAVRAAWTVRRLATAPWTVRVALRGVGRARTGDLTLAAPALLGPLLAAGVAGTYHFLAVQPELLSNLIGLGFCYGGLVMVSCTSFGIGSLILLGLFVYDIVMVFYTPFMVTVATTLDVPIKLVASAGASSSLLGLGDIVVPGLYVCLCLRYDLYRHYARQIRHVDTVLETETRLTPTAMDPAAPATTTTTTVTTATAVRAVKAPYIDPQGRWGDLLWTRGAAATPGLRAVRFPKPYFRVAMAAYTVGLLMAIGAMLATGRGQPALLYLVPTLLGATWARALWAGDLQEMWAYTEDGSQDVLDVVVDVLTNSTAKPLKKEGDADDGDVGSSEDHSSEDEDDDEDQDDEDKDDEDKDDEDKDEDKDGEADGFDVFSFSVQAPGTADIEATVF